MMGSTNRFQQAAAATFLEAAGEITQLVPTILTITHLMVRFMGVRTVATSSKVHTVSAVMAATSISFQRTPCIGEATAVTPEAHTRYNSRGTIRATVVFRTLA